MIHIMPAAAVPKHSLVIIPEIGEMEIDRIEYSKPRPGSLAWHDDKRKLEVFVSAILKIEVKELP